MGKNKDTVTLPRDFKALFLSDSHLLNPRNGAAAKQLQILQQSQSDELFLIGDIIDFERIFEILAKNPDITPADFPATIHELFKILEDDSKGFPDLEIHLRYFDVIFAKIAEGTKVTYIPGNHDENLDAFEGLVKHGIYFAKSHIYQSEDEKRYLVEHGHRFDPGFLQRNTAWYRIGSDILDHTMMADNWIGEQIPALKGAFFIANTTKAIGKAYIHSYQTNAIMRAMEEQVDGVISGHIHKLADKEIGLRDIFKKAAAKSMGIKKNDTIEYKNTGDGLTHGTAIGYVEGNEWMKIKPKNLDKSQRPTIETDNPHAQYRATTLEFLQESWEANLTLTRMKHDARQATAMRTALTMPAIGAWGKPA